jgi:outer membrane immunogenic protein
MKRFAALLTFSTLLAFGTTAQAADLVETPALYDWTGFYIGGNIGYAFGGNDEVGITGIGDSLGDVEINGIFGGGQIGVDWQVNSIVFGAVADIEGAAIYDDLTKDNVRGFDRIHASDDIDWWGTVRGRLGWAADRVLIYGTGGLAWADTEYRMRVINNGVRLADANDEETRVGYTVGGGLAWAVTDRWSIGAEYLYVNLGKFSVSDNGFKTEATPDFHSVKALVNFKF